MLRPHYTKLNGDFQILTCYPREKIIIYRGEMFNLQHQLVQKYYVDSIHNVHTFIKTSRVSCELLYSFAFPYGISELTNQNKCAWKKCQGSRWRPISLYTCKTTNNMPATCTIVPGAKEHAALRFGDTIFKLGLKVIDFNAFVPGNVS